jgi:hypothetical protein
MEKESGYTLREINLMFDAIREQLTGIREDIRNNNTYSEKRFEQIQGDMDKRFKQVNEEISLIRQEVKEINIFKVRALTIWGVIVTFATFMVNKIFVSS